MAAKRIGEMLVEAGLLRKADLDAALDQQRRSGGRLASICLALGLADEHNLAGMLSRQIGVPFVVLSRSAISRAAFKTLPGDLAKLLGVLPVWHQGSELLAAVADPGNLALLDEVRFITGAALVEHGALETPLREAIEAAYRPPKAVEEKFVVGPQCDPARLTDPSGYLEIVSGPSLDCARTPQPPGSLEMKVSQNLDADWNEPFTPARPRAGLAEPPTVLVVDDDDALRRMLVDYLRKSGFRVWEAVDGRQALARLQSDLPDAVVLDSMLPGVHGFEICRRIKQAEAAAHIPVVMISAVYRGGQYHNDLRLFYGASAFLEKPFKMERLKQLLNNCLADHKVPQDSEQFAAKAATFLAEANTAFRHNDLAGAAASLEAVISVAPFFPTIHQRLAQVCLGLKQNYRAIAHLEQAVQLEPTYTRLVLLAQTYERAGFSQKARDAWCQCLHLCETEAEAAWIRSHVERLSQ